MSNTEMGFDVSAVMGTKKIQVWIPFNDKMRVQINYISKGELSALITKATDVEWDRRRQKVEKFDDEKFGVLLGRAAVANWEGPVADGEPIPCTPENVERFMTHWLEFAKFVSSACTDLERLVEAEKAESLKK